MKPIRIALAAAAVAALAATAWWLTRPAADADPGAISATGTVDATEVAIAFRVPGTLRERPVDEGDRVDPGARLAALDAREAEARLRQAQAAAAAAHAQAEDLAAGSRPQEIAQARARLEAARVEHAHRRTEAERSQRLLDAGAIPRQRRDQDLSAADQAAEQLRAAEQQLALLREGPRPQTLAAARAQAAQADAAVEAARVALDDMQLQAPRAGTVTRTHAEPGETLAAGRPVLTLTDLARPWVRVYIPEHEIGRVRLGAPATITVDSHPGESIDGRVRYVAPQAEFTPKNVQTQAQRVKLVFAVDVEAANARGILKPGMPADVRIVDRTQDAS
jgi:HlyD family secretion protein